MATATRQVEQIVRKVLAEELDETVNAIQELSALVTEQVIPKLSGGAGDMPDSEQDEEPTEDEESEADGASMSAFNGSSFGRRRKPVNGHADDDDVEAPDGEVPESVVEAFADLYKTLSPEQSKAFADLFTAMENELEGDDADADEAAGENEAASLGRG